jgi:chromate transport protein ChrA
MASTASMRRSNVVGWRILGWSCASVHTTFIVVPNIMLFVISALQCGCADGLEQVFTGVLQLVCSVPDLLQRASNIPGRRLGDAFPVSTFSVVSVPCCFRVKGLLILTAVPKEFHV